MRWGRERRVAMQRAVRRCLARIVWIVLRGVTQLPRTIISTGACFHGFPTLACAPPVCVLCVHIYSIHPSDIRVAKVASARNCVHNARRGAAIIRRHKHRSNTNTQISWIVRGGLRNIQLVLYLPRIWTSMRCVSCGDYPTRARNLFECVDCDAPLHSHTSIRRTEIANKSWIIHEGYWRRGQGAI